ncbi:beta-ketoacyl synthase domain-containing protein [Xylariaceae sp. FL1651]|nr:beta-ketoacyl synthase domain-containing protein [Xylariaceae sp. FL1651]
MVSDTSSGPKEAIAVIGTGCRFPGGADSPSKLWEILKNPRDLMTKIPNERFNVDAFYHKDGSFHGRTNAPYSYLLDENIRAFDANFFSIQPHEAEVIDPQHRLLLETTYEALSTAGLRLEDLQGSSTAVYVGQMMNDYKDIVNYDLDGIPTYAATGTAASILSNRISYFFDWHGPSMTIDTACSSSLVAVHHAVQQLRTGSSRVAIAAGANLILSPVPFIVESKLNMLSPTGRSRMWDEAADGYARGEGVAAVVLKTLSQALQDGDSIECIIRESGINQDGRSPGITMPNHQAQEALILGTYKEAGLDPSRADDRCQYFEAHGTGTPAGDPQEAEAISKSFFGSRQRAENEDPLYVGSIKTVIGHTEGTAGIAGLIKASLAIQHRAIPPNLLFEKLSPRVAPFYQNLHIVTRAPQPWPKLAPGMPMRVSVNSFGFGGTNAHIIVESYQVPEERQICRSSAVPIIPITLSANSESALKTSMENLLAFLKTESSVQVQDIAWTLLQKRSALPVRRAITACTVSAACGALEAAIASNISKENGGVTNGSRKRPEVLGIFTGQGAQWPTMGKILISAVPYARDLISELDQSLSTLPPEYRPAWTLYEQLLLEGDASNVNDASFSQPLCCAVQILLVQLLTSAGISFKAVVGHSSGEIACAYAAGFITASQAIRIAHLRGVVSKQAASPNGVGGAMLAASCTYEDAEELSNLETLQGRICVAACNAPDSVTLSGDSDAVIEAQEILEDESKFARLLKVDKAYHSFHMLPCATPYLKAMEASKCAAVESSAVKDASEPSIIWISSVHKGKRMLRSDVTANYWKDNLLSPVLFAQALEQVMRDHSPVDIAVEVGCHPALKGPSLTTIENCISVKLPYTGCMRRGGDDLDAFANALGYIWERFGSESINLTSFNENLPQAPVKNLAKLLPRYPWDHSRSYYTETRRTRAFLRGAENKPHLLLGKLAAHSTPAALQWHNSIRPRDMPWLDGHQLQGQTVFPGAGYVVMATEAALHVAAGRSVQLIEITDLQIFKAVTFDDENSLVELSLSFEIDLESASVDQITARFRIDCCLAKESAMSPSTSGKIIITCGPTSSQALPNAQPEPPHMAKISVEAFYKELSGVGYDYTKEFRGIASIRRADNRSCGIIRLPGSADDSLLLHPATLDVAFQTLIAAVSAPGDGLMRSLLVPTAIGRIALNPWLCGQVEQSCEEVHYNASGTASQVSAIRGDIEVFDPRNQQVLFSIENITTKVASAATAANDHVMFTKWDWHQLVPDKLLNNAKYAPTHDDRQLMSVMERIVYYYIKSFFISASTESLHQLASHHEKQLRWFEHILDNAKNGQSLFYKSTWEVDTEADIKRLVVEYGENAHVRLIQRVGEGLQDVFYEGRNAFELMDHDGLLTEFYGSDSGFGPAYYYLQDAIAPITHRYQNMDILELGAGTGGATRYVLGTNPPAFNSYTFTDISTSFFERAHDTFAQFEDRMEFRALDVRRSPEEQGFSAHSYDMIIASNVLHATPKLEETMANVRTLLKPGGHLVVVELTNCQHSRIGFIFGLFIDWWAGVDEGRVLQPYVSIEQWDGILKRTGFSGIASRFEDDEGEIFPTSVFRSEAVNDKILRLSQPLSALPKDLGLPIVVVGGASPKTLKILDAVQNQLPTRQFHVIKRPQDVNILTLESKFTFLILSELDDEMFPKMDQSKFDSMKTLCNIAKHMLWVTENAWVGHPHQAMTIGLLRTLRLEYVDVQIQVLDIDDTKNLEPKSLTEHLLRLEDGSDWEDTGILWSAEPEIFISQGRTLIPRLRPDRLKNDRLNSRRREILVDTDLAVSTVILRQGDGATYLQTNESYAPGQLSTYPSSTIRVHHSLGRAVRVSNVGFFNLVQGTTEGQDRTVVALSAQNGSLVEVSPNCVIPLPESHGLKTDTLVSIAADLLAQTLIADTAPGATILIYMPSQVYARSIAHRARTKGVRVAFASTQPAPEPSNESWIQLHERETQRGLAKALPAHVHAFYNFSVDQSPVSLGQCLSRRFAKTCPTFQVEHLSQMEASIWTEAADTTLNMLGEAVKVACNNPQFDVPATPVDELVTLQRRIGLSTVVNWRVKEVIPARVRPVDSGRLFSHDRSYLLVGLTGDLGRSICRWMLGHGARHVVLSSRRPQVEPRWVEEMAELGGNVLVLPMNVANEQSLDAGLARIQKSMPPIGGIAFGPLVLKDVLFKNMDLSMMEAVLEPKVKGARLLNERLCESKHPLEFFVMFSSFVMVCGNPGQAAYSAANAYTHSLAQQRRARGLAGSTIDMGAIWGVGYIVRQGRDEEYETISFKFDKVSEQELHALFAEAVVSGRPDATDDAEVITGMRFLDPKNKELIPHFSDPRLGYFILSEQRGSISSSGNALESVKDRLLKAETIDEVRLVITDGLAEKLRTTLQIPHEDSVDLVTPLIDQGVDSLSAVTIGTWFSKNLNLELPLLKILGGASVNDLAEEATERLHPSAIPLVRPMENTVETKAALHINGGDTQTSKVDRDAQLNGETKINGHSAQNGDTKLNGVTKLNGESKSNGDTTIQRKVRMSLNQEHSWKLQKHTHDPTMFNSTIGMYMKGHMDLERLSQTFRVLLQRHEILRTCFPDTGNDSMQPMQTIMKVPYIRFEAFPVENREAAEQGFADVDNQKYNLAVGDTLKIVDFYWAPDEHILVIAYNQLVFDGWSYERLFVELTQLYDGVELPPAPQYADFAVRQQMNYEHGRLDEDIAYWKSIYKTIPSVLPIMSLPQAQARKPLTWSHHTSKARVSSNLASRIRETSRKWKATPMQFYLAAYYVMLARLTGSADISVGVADANRPDLDDLSTMGFFVNILPLRFAYSMDCTFSEALSKTKEQMRSALLHSRIPNHIIMEKLGIKNPTEPAPLFQAVFDYKQGQAESGSIGSAYMAGVLASRSRTPYDITLEMSDDPTRDPLVTVKLQSCIYGADDAQTVMESYMSILTLFSQKQGLAIHER